MMVLAGPYSLSAFSWVYNKWTVNNRTDETSAQQLCHLETRKTPADRLPPIN